MGHDTTGRDVRLNALSRLIDYAGLFPPARLAMGPAIAGYREARGGANSWMVDRFICPASRLDEFADSLDGEVAADQGPWPIAVTADGGIDAVDADARLMATFEQRVGGLARVEHVEASLPSSDAAGWVVEAAALFGRPVFFEVPWRDGTSAALDSVAAARATSEVGVKLRCGGLTAEAFPPPGVVAAVMAGCRERGLPLKATAGLHHPFRHLDPDTGFIHHGFVNLLTAAVAAFDGCDLATLTEIVADGDAGAFTFNGDDLGWRDRRFASTVVAESRKRLFVGYGSCSFDEPVEDLTMLGVLPVVAVS